MAQDTSTGVGTKSEFDNLTADDVNGIVTTVEANATDAESRLATLEAGTVDVVAIDFDIPEGTTTEIGNTTFVENSNNLVITNSGTLTLDAPSLTITSGSGESRLVTTDGVAGTTALHYGSSNQKLVTTSGGINVTGTVAATAITLSGDNSSVGDNFTIDNVTITSGAISPRTLTMPDSTGTIATEAYVDANSGGATSVTDVTGGARTTGTHNITSTLDVDGSTINFGSAGTLSSTGSDGLLQFNSQIARINAGSGALQSGGVSVLTWNGAGVSVTGNAEVYGTSMIFRDENASLIDPTISLIWAEPAASRTLTLPGDQNGTLATQEWVGDQGFGTGGLTNVADTVSGAEVTGDLNVTTDITAQTINIGSSGVMTSVSNDLGVTATSTTLVTSNAAKAYADSVVATATSIDLPETEIATFGDHGSIFSTNGLTKITNNDTAGDITLQADTITLQTNANQYNRITTTAGISGTTRLHYGDSQTRLTTTVGGVSVTGNVAATGYLTSGGATLRGGSTHPEADLTAATGSTFQNTDLGQLNVKRTGSGDTGWAEVATYGLGFDITDITGTSITVAGGIIIPTNENEDPVSVAGKTDSINSTGTKLGLIRVMPSSLGDVPIILFSAASTDDHDSYPLYYVESDGVDILNVYDVRYTGRRHRPAISPQRTGMIPSSLSNAVRLSPGAMYFDGFGMAVNAVDTDYSISGTISAGTGIMLATGTVDTAYSIYAAVNKFSGRIELATTSAATNAGIKSALDTQYNSGTDTYIVSDDPIGGFYTRHDIANIDSLWSIDQTQDRSIFSQRLGINATDYGAEVPLIYPFHEITSYYELEIDRLGISEDNCSLEFELGGDSTAAHTWTATAFDSTGTTTTGNAGTDTKIVLINGADISSDATHTINGTVKCYATGSSDRVLVEWDLVYVNSSDEITRVVGAGSNLNPAGNTGEFLLRLVKTAATPDFNAGNVTLYGRRFK